MNELIEYQCIDFKKLLILKAKSLHISDQEAYVLLLIMTMNDIHMKMINPQTIAQLSSMTKNKIDKTLMSILDKHLINRKNGQLDLSPLYHLLLNEETKEESKELDLISLFENAFSRSLSQIEVEFIQSYKNQGYDDQMILDALNEAVKSNALNFRYIEKVLENWSKYGVKRRFAQTPKKEISVDESIKDYNWWDKNE